MKEKYRIFLSYRGISTDNSEGKAFAEDLYKYYLKDVFWKERYGNIYYSPKTDITGNYIHDIPEIMENVEFFVMPLTKEYFADFWDEEHDCPDAKSVPYKEIRAALTHNIKFICIAFPGFELDQELLNKLFDDDASVIGGTKQLFFNGCNQKEVFMQICDVTLKHDISGIGDILSKSTPNVTLSFKANTESNNQYPFYKRLFDVKKITLINYAASSFISGIDIALSYSEHDSLKRWFMNHLSNGDIVADIVLTDPLSYAAMDAAEYKMFPEDKKRDLKKSEIILNNMNKLFNFMKKNPQAKLNVYLTNIALPYCIMKTEHTNHENDHIKIDIYSPVIQRDGLRPSFYLLKNDVTTSDLYNFFSSNADQIREMYSYPYTGHPKLDWMYSTHKRIIHKGMINNKAVPHKKSSILECVDAGYPIEVDLLILKDGAVIIGRKDEYISLEGKETSLADCTISDINRYNRHTDNNKILSLEQLFSYINGQVPLLLEIKADNRRITDKEKESYQRITSSVTKYMMVTSSLFSRKLSYNHGVAIHSSNPFVLEYIKSINCMIPCGIIISDFSKRIEDVGKDFADLHNKQTYLEFFEPDFISSDIRYIETEIPQDLKRKLNIPMLGWTVRDIDDQETAEYHCDNIIIEGAKSYI